MSTFIDIANSLESNHDDQSWTIKLWSTQEAPYNIAGSFSDDYSHSKATHQKTKDAASALAKSWIQNYVHKDSGSLVFKHITLIDCGVNQIYTECPFLHKKLIAQWGSLQKNIHLVDSTDHRQIEKRVEVFVMQTFKVCKKKDSSDDDCIIA